MKEKKQQPSIKRKKPILPIVLILVIVIVLAALPKITESRNVEENPSILSVQASAAQIDTSIHTAGALTDREAESVSLPEDVELSFVVKNGDTVKAGDLIATVDKESLMITIAQLQENLETMDERIEDAMDESTTSQLEAPAAGRVKAIYAENGENITDVMYDHGALAILSLDGLMALDVTWSDGKVGAAVQVTLSDGTVVSGRVDSLSGSKATVTLSDETAALGETVSVADSEGNVIGGGELYVHQQLAVTSYYGQVEEVSVQVGDELDAGDTLMTLTDAETTAGYAGLLSQRQQMEEQMNTLFTLYQAGGLYAESDGIVAEISEDDNLEAVMAAQASYRLKTMANSPDGTEGYTNFAATVTAVDGTNVSMMLCPVTISDMDYADTQLLESLPYTQITGYSLPENTMVYVQENGVWVMKNLSEIRVNDKLILAFADVNAAPVWIVCHHPLQEEPSQPGDEQIPDTGVTTPTTPVAPEEGETPSMPSEDEQQNDTTLPDTGSQQLPQGGLSQQMPQGSSNWGSGMTGSMDAGSITIAIPGMEAAADLILAETVVYTLTPDTDMTVELMIDEMDLSRVFLGQEVSVVLDALPDAELNATVTAIADTSDSESGSAKYAVEITLERLLEMRSGMNAAVTIPVSTTDAACTVPVAALVEQDGKSWVYTSYDKETDTLGSMVEVTTGVSDGETVEILSGLNSGDTVYYSYTEVIEYEFVQ